MHHSTGGTRRAGGLLAGAMFVLAAVPQSALAASSGSSDWTSIANNLGEKGKAIGAVVGGLMLIVMLIVAWAKQSMAGVAMAVAMGIVAAMAVNGGLWKTSENTAKSLSSGSGLTSGSGGTP